MSSIVAHAVLTENTGARSGGLGGYNLPRTRPFDREFQKGNYPPPLRKVPADPLKKDIFLGMLLIEHHCEVMA